MKTGYKISKEHFEIYNFDIIFSLYYQPYYQDLLDKLEKLYKLDYESLEYLSNCHGLCYSTGDEKKFYIFINMTKNKTNKKLYNTCAHEIYHCVEDIKTYFDLHYNPGGANEHLSYLTGAISERLLSKLIK